MRSWIYILVIGLTMSACTKSEQVGTQISILEDRTEEDFIAKPNPIQIKQKFGLDEDSWKSAIFRHGHISSLVHNERAEIKLIGGTALLGNQLERDAEVEAFYKRTDSILNNRIDVGDYPYSSIWKPIVEELVYLQKDTINSTELYVYSDLQENNSEWFSVHRYKDMLQLERQPERVKELFLKHASRLKRTDSTIKVIVVYQPRTIKEDKAFALMKALYTSIFKELNLPIEFVSNLN